MISFIGGNQIQLLRNGAEYFPALELAIDQAQSEIYLQTYIFEPDTIGIRIADALKRAAQRGVMVNILLDGFGCKDLVSSFVKELETAGVNVMFYRPKISPWTLKKSRLRRMHRKVSVFDKTVAFVGGINIIDDFDVPKNAQLDEASPRLDYAVRIEGPLLPEILNSATKLWKRMSVLHLQADNLKAAQSADLTRFSAGKNLHQYKNSTANAKENIIKNVSAAFILRDNVLNRRSIENAYLSAIKQAKSEIIIANAYFVPGRRFRKALLAAAKRGVSVKLLLQGRMEYFLMFATHAYYAVFLKKGIQIYEYRKGYMHSKVAVIDNEWATVGSSNIDPFSLLLAREANVIVKDKGFTAELRSDIMRSIEEDAYHVEAQEWQNRHMFKQLLSCFAYGLMRVFVGLIGYSKQQ